MISISFEQYFILGVSNNSIVMSTPADIVKPVETIKKSVSTKMSMMYINGMSVSIMCDVNEMDVQRRKGWIERRIRESNDFSPS